MRYDIFFGSLPFTWDIEPLYKYADVIDPHPSHRAPKEIENGYPFLGIGDLDYFGNATYSAARHVGLEVIKDHEKNYKINNKSIGYAKMGNTIGKIVSFPERCFANRYAVSPALSIINPLDNINPNYLRAVVESQSFWGQVNGKITGSTRPSIGIQQLRNILIPIPPKNEQNIIGDIWKTIFDRMLINKGINNNLLQQAMALYGQFSPYSIDDPIPKGWRVGTIADIVEIHDSRRIPLSGAQRAKMTKRTYPYYGAASLMDFVDDYIFDGVYLLLGEDGTVVDDAGYPILQYVWGQFWVNNHAHILTGKEGFSVESLMLLFKKTPVKSIVTGAVQPKISQANLKSIPVVIPPMMKMETFSKTIHPLFDQIRLNHDQNKALASLRDTLLPKLMSGEIDVSNIAV